MTRSKKNYDLGDVAYGMLVDFCEAHYGAPEVHIIREAVEFFVEDRLAAEPEMRKRYERARSIRLGENIRALPISNSNKS